MSPKSTKKRTGRPPRHGGFSLLVKAGEIPERLTYVRAYLTACREGLIQNAAGKEESLTAAQLILIDRATSVLGVIRTIEETLAEEGIMKGGVLAPVLQDCYLAYVNSLRLILRELGIKKQEHDGPLDPLAIAAEIDKGKDKGAPEIVDPGASERETIGENHERNEGQAGSVADAAPDALLDQEGRAGVRVSRGPGEEAADPPAGG